MTEDPLVSATEGARLFGIPASRIHKWKARGHLMPVEAVRGPGCTATVPLFRLSELAALVAERHAARQRRRPSVE